MRLYWGIKCSNLLDIVLFLIYIGNFSSILPRPPGLVLTFGIAQK